MLRLLIILNYYITIEENVNNKNIGSIIKNQGNHYKKKINI